MKQKSLMFFFGLAISMTIWSCGGATEKATAKKAAPQKKETVTKPKGAKKATKKNIYGGRVLSKRAARGKIMRVQGTPLSGKSNITVSAKNGEVKILGWAFDDVSQKPAQKVFLEINGKRFGTSYGHDNAALAKRLKNSKLMKTSFRCSVPVKEVKGKSWNVKLITYAANGKAVSVSKAPIVKIRIK